MLLLRRFIRVVSLHAIDGALLTGLMLVLADHWRPALGLRPYIPAVVTVFLISLNAVAAYRPGEARRDRRRLLSGTALALVIITFLSIFPPRLPFRPDVLSVLAGAAFLLLAFGRAVADQVMRQAYARGIGVRRAVILGNLDEVSRVIQQIRDDRNVDQYVVGHLTPADEPDPTALGQVIELPSVLRGMRVQEVIVATTLPRETVQWIAEWCFGMGAALYMIPVVTGYVDCRAEPMRVGACPLLHLQPVRVELPLLWLKRLFDLLLAPVLLVLAAPIMLAIALMIKIEGPGPIFFRQTRVGLGGRAFRVYKFRSMRVDAEAVLRADPELYARYVNGNYKLSAKEDPRISAFGAFIRRTSLDELPQLLNVLRGDMSLIGPRPVVPLEVREYGDKAAIVLGVRPGITGYWQVSGRSDVGYPERVDMDVHYVSNWSFGLDMAILFRTVPYVLRRRGAF